jgi:hypothetical protein
MFQWMRAAGSLLVLAIMVAAPLTARAKSPDYGPGFTDITGSTVRVDFAYTDKQGHHQDVELDKIPRVLLAGLPADAQQLVGNPIFTTPLNQAFDQAWSATRDKNGQTLQAVTCATVRGTVLQQVSQRLGASADVNSCNLASKGSIGAKVADGNMTPNEPPGWHDAAPFYWVPGGQYIMLSYWLPNNKVTFTVHKPFDPAFTLSFDAEIIILADLTADPPAACTTAVYGWAEAHNADLSAANTAGAGYEAIGSVLNWVQGQPSALFQSAEGQIDQTVTSIGPLGQVSSGLSQLASACTAARTYGFTQFSASMQGNTLALTFSHPDLSQPQLTNLTAQQNGGSFFNDLITPAQLEVHAGDPLGVTGSLDIPQVSELRIGWTAPPPSGDSNVRWGPRGGSQTTTTPSGNEFDPTNLTPNTTYEFQVQVCDAVSCSPWSSPLTATTSVAGADGVVFRLANSGGGCGSQRACPTVGRSTLQSDGSVDATVTIPAATRPGQYTLRAQVGSGSNPQVATAPLTVVAANQDAQPILAMWDTVDNRPYAPGGGRTLQNGAFTLYGEGFHAGGTVTVALDTRNGQVLGTATVDGDGTFKASCTMAYTSIGTHTLVVTENPGVQATLSVTVEGALQ